MPRKGDTSMSSSNPRRRVRTMIIGTAATALTALGLVLAFSGGGVGADFTSSAPVVGSANAGTLDLGVSGSLSFDKLVPGVPQTSSVTLTNTGTVAGTVITIGAPVTVNNWSLPSGHTPDFSQVVVTVANSNLPANTPLTELPSVITLDGGINAATDANHPGTKTLTVTLEILDESPAVNNALQGASVTGSVTATESTGH